MTAQLLDGKQLAETLKSALKEKISTRIKKGLPVPGLAVILIGNDAASTIYVNNKRRACMQVGITSYAYDLPESTSEEKLLKLIHELNTDDKITGILIQLPLPPHIDTEKIIEAVNPSKDVDGFHPYNIGKLTQRNPILRPCTPAGIICLLQEYNISLQGKDALVIGASNIVGRPMALEFLLAAATVSICHRFTTDLAKYVRQAEIIVVATGICNIIDPEWLSTKQILIDVGMHRLKDGSLRGDVNFAAAREKVAWITPVPGGVGPMTIAMLLQNTFTAAQLQDNKLNK